MDFWLWNGQHRTVTPFPKPALPAGLSAANGEGRSYRFDAERFWMQILLAPGRQRIVRPVLFVWGFDPGSVARTDSEFMLLLNGTWTDSDEAADPNARLIEALWDIGLDVLILVPRDTTKLVQYNAEGVMHCLRLLRDGRDIPKQIGFPVASTAVIGISMGGIIARYAMLKMERAGEAHNAAFYFSYDSPHRGANIPLSVQYFLDYFHKTELGIEVSAIAAKRNLLLTPAAAQLAIYHFDAPPLGKATGQRWESQSQPQPHPLRTQLVHELAVLGDYPLPHERRFAISNGSRQVTMGNPSGMLLQVKIGPLGNPGTILKAMPHYDTSGNQTTEIAVCWSGLNKWRANVKVARPVDVAPGSVGSFIKDVRTNLASALGPLRAIVHIEPNFHDRVCFIPTTSALDAGDDVWNGGGAATNPFAGVYVNASHNEAHVRVTTSIQSFIVDKLRAWAAA